MLPAHANVKQDLSLTDRPWSFGLVELSMPNYGLASVLVSRLTRSHENPIERTNLKFQVVARSLRFWSILTQCLTMKPGSPQMDLFSTCTKHARKYQWVAYL